MSGYEFSVGLVLLFTVIILIVIVIIALITGRINIGE